jgi:hypothetical protein
MKKKIRRRKKSRPAQVADTVVTALKLKAAWEVAEKAAKRTPVVRRVPIIVAGGAGTVIAVKKLRGGKPTVDAATPAPADAAPGAKVPA